MTKTTKRPLAALEMEDLAAHKKPRARTQRGARLARLGGGQISAPPDDQTRPAPDCSYRLESRSLKGETLAEPFPLSSSKRTRFSGKSRRTSFRKRSRSNSLEKPKVTFWPAARQSRSAALSREIFRWLKSAKARRHSINAKSRALRVAVNRYWRVRSWLKSTRPNPPCSQAFVRIWTDFRLDNRAIRQEDWASTGVLAVAVWGLAKTNW